MMELKRNSRLVKWAYKFSDFGPPDSTTLCRFFWRAFVFMPLVWLFIVGSVGLVVGGIGVLIWQNLLTTVKVAGFLLSLVAVVGFVAYHVYYTEWTEVTLNSINRSTFVQGVKAVKSKFCPIIYITRRDV